MLTAQALRISWCPLHGQDHVVQGSVVYLRLYWEPQDLLPSYYFKCQIQVHGGHCEKEEKAGKIAYDFQFMKNHNSIVFLSFSNLNIFILLKYSWLTIFLVHSKLIQLYIYTVLCATVNLCCCCCCLVTSVVSDSVWPHRQQPTRLRRPWDSPGKYTGVGGHFFSNSLLLVAYLYF